jgi:ribosome-binding factor A
MEEVKDQKAKEAIITGVDVTNDLSYAKVYFTIYNRENKKEVLEALNTAEGFIRRCLADRIEIRNTPELRFIYDESEEYGKHIDEIIENLNK